MSYYGTTPSSSEALAAHFAYNDWARSENESLEEYVYRKRTVDLSVLLDEVIENELSLSEKYAITKKYFESKSVSEVSKELSLSPSTISRTLMRAEEKIQSFLKYAVMFQHNQKNTEFLPLAVREAFCVSAAKRSAVFGFSEMLIKLRKSENLTLSSLHKATKIPLDRLMSFENGKEQPTLTEIILLSEFFQISADKLIKGGYTHEYIS